MHAEERRAERGYRSEEIEEIILYPEYIKKREDDKKEVHRTYKNREMIIVYEEKENYIRIVTLI